MTEHDDLVNRQAVLDIMCDVDKEVAESFGILDWYPMLRQRILEMEPGGVWEDDDE